MSDNSGNKCTVRPSHLDAAFRALGTHDFVIGPANDGGYYHLGMRYLEPAVFQGKNWSTESVFPDTINDIQKAGRIVHLLPELSDIDYEADLMAALARNDSKL